MTMVSIGSLAAGVANAAAGNAVAEPITAEAIYWPAWILAIGVLLALLIVIGILSSLRSQLLARPKKRNTEFTHMLCKQVWEHTNRVTGVFAERLRHPQRDVATLRVLLRLLREDLGPPVNFVGQMRPHAPATWPDYALFAAYNNWSGQLSAIETLVRDLQHMLSYPVVKEPVDAHRDAMLVYYYTTEQATLGQAIAQLVTYAIAICDAAKKVLEKEPGHGFSFGFGDKDEHDHDAGCTACESPTVHTPFVSNSPQEILPLPEPPKKEEKKKEEPKAQQLCYCMVPQPCHCMPAACVCACSCKSASAPASVQ